MNSSFEQGLERQTEVGANRGPEPRCALGVLFVHGIGTQQRGETLAEFARPIYQWLKESFRWLPHQLLRDGASPEQIQVLSDALRSRDQSSGYSVETTGWGLEELHELLERAQASPRNQTPTPPHQPTQHGSGDTVAARVTLSDARLTVPGDPEAPAHGHLVLDRLRLDGVLEEERWLLAESWWAETFAAPRFSDVARWGLVVLPWTIGSHFGAGVGRVWRERRWHAGVGKQVLWLGRLASAALSLLTSLLFSLGALFALFMILLLAVLPIPSLRRGLATLQQKIAASLGDSYVLLTRPIEAAAIVSQVSRDLDWLATRCEQVAIVAHSQGAAVVHEALRGRRPNNLRMLFTFGSGLRKLEELRHILGVGRRFQRAAVFTLVGLIFAGLSLFVGAETLLGSGQPNVEVLGQFSMFAAGSLTAVAIGLRAFVAGVDLGELRRRIQRFACTGIRWVDCYGTSDPVSNGPLLATVKPSPRATHDGVELENEFPETVEIWNERSISRDHTTV